MGRSLADFELVVHSGAESGGSCQWATALLFKFKSTFLCRDYSGVCCDAVPDFFADAFFSDSAAAESIFDLLCFFFPKELRNSEVASCLAT